MSPEPHWAAIRSILFLCHGNICRSTMAESLLAHLLAQHHLEQQIEVDSAATSQEELGNPIHPGARQELLRHQIPIRPHFARQITQRDLAYFDLILAMDQNNLRNFQRLFGPSNKLHLLLEWSPSPRNIADPWYTGDFTETWNDLSEGCQLILQKLLSVRT